MKPLEGLLVIELSTMITASFAAMMMAEQGARVIKVEPLGMGDPLRYLGHNKGGISSIFASCNRGKESIRVDLKTEAGQKILRQLSSSADVLMHNFRPGVMDKLNLGSESLRKDNKRLINMAISGFGTEGPMARAPAYDPVIQVQTGMTDVQGGEGHGFVNNLICDKITAYTACQAATAALYQREKTGVGQHIDLSMMDASLFYIFPDGFMAHNLLDDDVVPGIEMRDIYHLTPTLDGQITFSAGVKKQMLGVLKVIGREDLTTKTGFPLFKKMLAEGDGFELMVDEFMAKKTTEEALALFNAVDVPCAACLALTEVVEHAQVKANHSVVETEHPLMGKMYATPSPARFGGEQLPLGAPCPSHGEHTMHVLEGLGLDAAELEQLLKDQVVA